MFNFAPKEKSASRRTAKWLTIAVAGFLILGGLITEEIMMAGRVYPGVKVGQLALGFKTVEQAQALIQSQGDQFTQTGVIVSGRGKTIAVNPAVIAPGDPDLSYEILFFDNQEMLKQAWQVGRDQNQLTNLKNRFLALMGQKQLPVSFEIDDWEFEKILKKNFGGLENPAKNSELTFIGGRAQASQESGGRAFDYDLTLAAIRQNAGQWQNRPVEMILKPDWPTIKKADTDQALAQAEAVIQLAPITLNAEKQQWSISQEQLKQWLRFEVNSLTPNFTGQFRQIILSLKKDEVLNWLKTVAPAINIEAQDAKFKIENGQVMEFQASRDGQIMDLEKTYYQLNQQIVKEQKKEAAAVIKTALAKITTGEVNDLGINELVGAGQSNFSGSPKNRRHNIAVGAKALNGVLIKPGEEFSLVKTLGATDAKAGYLPELVIKGNETVPEYGGGLCQIGTTAFRVALNAGLPITERKNHSYRVSYYEPAGTDATIYNPRPDLKFINDTPAHLILQTRIEGDELIFELYGTKDGRVVEQTEPKIFNFVSPGPTKIIETLDLKPGEKKCTERAHTGADTEFTRKITYGGGEVKEETWTSHYRPWQEVCLLGVENPPAGGNEQLPESPVNNEENKTAD